MPESFFDRFEEFLAASEQVDAITDSDAIEA